MLISIQIRYAFLTFNRARSATKDQYIVVSHCMNAHVCHPWCGGGWIAWVRRPSISPHLSKLAQLSDGFGGYPLQMFTIPTHYKDDLDTILLPNGLIRDR